MTSPEDTPSKIPFVHDAMVKAEGKITAADRLIFSCPVISIILDKVNGFAIAVKAFDVGAVNIFAEFYVDEK